MVRCPSAMYSFSCLIVATGMCYLVMYSVYTQEIHRARSHDSVSSELDDDYGKLTHQYIY